MFQVVKLDLHNLQPNKITVCRREVFLKAPSYPRNRWYLKTAEKERVSFIYGCGPWQIAPVPVKDHIPKSDSNNTYNPLAPESHTLLSTSIIISFTDVHYFCLLKSTILTVHEHNFYNHLAFNNCGRYGSVMVNLDY